MIRPFALAVLLALAGCAREPADMASDADAEAQATTATETLNDLAAAEAAARRPMPVIRPQAEPRQLVADTVAPRPASSPPTLLLPEDLNALAEDEPPPVR